jgi:hypothetical protein
MVILGPLSAHETSVPLRFWMKLKLYGQEQRSRTSCVRHPKTKASCVYYCCDYQTNISSNHSVSAIYLVGFNSVANPLALELNALWNLQKTRISM